MTEQIEAQLREALAQRAAEVPASASARLRQIDYHPRSPYARSVLAGGAIAGLAGTAGIVISIAGLGAGTAPAFAGWTPLPTHASVAQVSAAEASCLAQPLPTSDSPASEAISSGNASAAAGGAWRVVLTDTRGPYTVMIIQSTIAKAIGSCFVGPSPSSQAEAEVTFYRGGPVGGSLPAGQIRPVTPPRGDSDARDGRKYTHIEGLTGSSVTRVTLQLADGSTVQASTANGWFVAWWPGSQQAVAAEVTAASRTSTLQLAG